VVKYIYLYVCLSVFSCTNDSKMIVRFVDTQKQPLKGAVISIARAPGGSRDIAMIADDSGKVSVPVTAPGEYVFSVFYNGQNYQVSTSLQGQDQNLTLTVQ
jgi:uncharacterized surface anchored protein